MVNNNKWVAWVAVIALVLAVIALAVVFDVFGMMTGNVVAPPSPPVAGQGELMNPIRGVGTTTPITIFVGKSDDDKETYTVIKCELPSGSQEKWYPCVCPVGFKITGWYGYCKKTGVEGNQKYDTCATSFYNEMTMYFLHKSGANNEVGVFCTKI